GAGQGVPGGVQTGRGDLVAGRVVGDGGGGAVGADDGGLPAQGVEREPGGVPGAVGDLSGFPGRVVPVTGRHPVGAGDQGLPGAAGVGRGGGVGGDGGEGGGRGVPLDAGGGQLAAEVVVGGANL